MKIQTFFRLFALSMSITMLFGAGICLLSPHVKAASTTHKLETLLGEGKLKALGRSQASLLGDGITADWSGNGFEVKLNIASGDVIIGYNSNRSVYSAVLVDGVQVWRGLTTGTGTIRIPVTPGSHTVSAIRENGHSSPPTGSTVSDASFLFTTLAFDGTVEAKPADKPLYIEVIGDSYACGSGSAADYAPGVQWGDSDHSVQASFGWYLSKMLNSDLSIVARGGIGLLGNDSQESTTGSASMLAIYPYASGHNINEGAYDFANARKPDLVVIEMGANDSINVNNLSTVSTWNAKLDTLIATVRANYGAGTKILLLSHKADIYTQMLLKADSDENIWSCHFSHHGNGSAALKSQKEGHPSAEDEYEIAQALYKTIQDWDILAVPTAAPAAPTYTDITYYVSENGSDSNDGKTIETAKLTVKAAYDQAFTDRKTFPAGSRLVLQLQGTVLYTTVGGNQALFGTTRYTADGKKLPILVTTYDYTDTKAILDTAHKAVNGGNAAQCFYNDVTLKDVTIQGTTRPHTSTSNGVTTTVYYRDRNLYGGFNDIVFDNVSFAHAVDSSVPAGQATATPSGWVISPGRFGSFNPNAEADPAKKTGSITFKNGDYTQNIDWACAVSFNNYTDQTTAPGVTHKLIIDDGAIMGTVYGTYGTLPVDSAIVELRGGTVNTYHPTRNGKYTYNAKNITTIFCGTDVQNTNFFGTGENTTVNSNVTTVFSSGKQTFTNYYGTGENATVNGTVTTRFNGGSLEATAFYGTGVGAIVTGTVTNEISKGRFVGQRFAGLGESTTLNSPSATEKGKVVNNVSGGELRVVPQSTSTGVDGFYFGGYTNAIINGNVENNISGGDINLLYTAKLDSGIYLGTKGSSTTSNTEAINGDLINNISGGNLFIGQTGTELVTSANIYLGMYKGDITGTHYNNITGGTLSISAYNLDSKNNPAKLTGVSFGTRTVHNTIGKIVNVIGIKGSSRGPRILGNVALGGDKGYVGAKLPTANNDGKATPVIENYKNYRSDVVIDSTIYSGYISGIVYGATNSSIGTNYSYVIGSVKTDIYGGKIAGSFYGNGSSIVTGHVTTNFYGGSVSNIYGARNGNVFDGVETNIYGLTELISVFSSKTENGKTVYYVPDYRIYAGGTTGTISATTEGRDAVKLTIAPTAGTQLRLKTPIYAGCNGTGVINGSCKVEIRGGIFPNGLKVDGKTVGDILPSGYTAKDHISGDALSYANTDSQLTGYVEVVPNGQNTGRELIYYVRPNGDDTYDGLSFVTAKKTVAAAFDQAVAHNGGSTVFPNGSQLTIYVDGTVNDNSQQQLLCYMHYLSTQDGKPMESVVTTYKYSGTKATIVHNFSTTSSASSKVYARTSITLKDINLMSKAPTAANGKQTLQLFAGGRTITFDNASLITNNGAKWIVSADHFATGGVDATKATAENPMQGTLIFKNGDYRDLDYVTTVQSTNIGTATSTPHQHCKVIIQDGALMNDVYGPVGTLAVGSSTVEVCGGSVNNLRGTGNGTKHIGLGTNVIISGGSVGTLRGTGNCTDGIITGDVNITVTGGTVNALYGTGNGNYVSGTNKANGSLTIEGDVNITVSGGTIKNYQGSGNVLYDSANALTGALIITGKVKNTISGGDITNFSGTGDGYSASIRASIGAVENVISGGTFDGKWFLGAGNYLLIDGVISNTIKAGNFTIIPVASDQYDAYFFAGRKNVTAGSVENTISGGTFTLLYNTTVDSAFYFGGSSSALIKGNVTNTITGGTFQPKDGNAAGKNGCIYLGQYSGQIQGSLINNLVAFTYDASDLSASSNLSCGPRATKAPIQKIENTIGDSQAHTGPVLKPKNGKTMHLQLGAGWCQVGCSQAISSANSYPAPESAADAAKNVVIENTIYGGTFPSTVYGAPSGSMDNAYYNIANGSIVTNIYGGTFQNFQGAGLTTVFGHVTTNIWGGSFAGNLLGGSGGLIHDGVELNIYGMNEGSDPAIYAGGSSATVNTVTAGRAGIQLTIAPTGKLVLSKAISAGFSGTGTNNGSTEVTVSGGTYTNGFAVTGVTVKDALADGHCVVEDATGIPLTIPDKDIVSGTTSVTVLPTDDRLQFSGASVTLCSDLSVSFKVNKDIFGETGFDAPHVMFRMAQQQFTVSDYVIDGDRYAFPFQNIAPQRMGDTITATMYATKDGVLYVGKPMQYSIKQYCTNMLSQASDNAELRTLLVDLLHYGAAAQLYTGHNTDHLVNADLTDAQKAWGTQGDSAVDASAFSPGYATVENPAVTWLSGGLYLDDRIAFRMTLEADDITNLTIKITICGNTYECTQEDLIPVEGQANQYHLYFDKLDASHMRDDVLFTAYRGEEAVSNTIRYSVECYIARKQNDNTIPHLAELLKSIIRYGDSAYAFKH